MAVAGIDDKLITEAQQASKRNRLRPVYGLCALAACLVLVFTFIFAPGNRSSAPVLLLNESTITSSPAMIDVPATVMSRDADNRICINLALETKQNTKITVSGGEIHVCSRTNTDTLYYTGKEYTTDIPVNIDWIIDGSDITKSYTLTLNDDEIVYTLSFDEENSQWSICKQ